MITPAISVLSAVEGLEVATPVLKPYVIPITIAVLVGLFVVQSRGSERIRPYFGPVMALWFTVLAIAGLVQVVGDPGVLAALNPLHALGFLAGHGSIGFLALGSVFLALTGAEALYADMGHFGRSPIRLDWFAFVLPALVLNYFGQGALVLVHPEAVDSPFFKLFPDWGLWPVVMLATAATVIASQAVISGAFSLSQQAVQLGLLPRLDIRQTSQESIGQVYVPQINWLLMVPAALEAHQAECPIDVADTSVFLGRETPVVTVRPELPLWREKLYAFMGRNAVGASDYFQIPPKRVVELGTQVEL